MLLFKASLSAISSVSGEAFRLLDRVVAIGRRCDDSHLCGKALITRGFLLGLADDPEAAIRHLTEGLQKVDPASDPRLVVAAQHNLTLYLAESGRYREALRLLQSAPSAVPPGRRPDEPPAPALAGGEDRQRPGALQGGRGVPAERAARI